MATDKATSFELEDLPAIPDRARARMDALTDSEITAAAEADPDNPPLTPAELAKLELRALARRARARTGLTQREFARAYRISFGRLRDIEQGRYPGGDSVVAAYLAVIAREPEAVRRALSEV
ncbi:helix-turn-helix domain-containing protein [Phenylobacterium sp.]|uniref:helix-turn-helix domain-containing protein n=1 Tax=Phenylobacterium sp. TaxID=1871053 RepID=UPI00301C2B37